MEAPPTNTCSSDTEGTEDNLERPNPKKKRKLDLDSTGTSSSADCKLSSSAADSKSSSTAGSELPSASISEAAGAKQALARKKQCRLGPALQKLLAPNSRPEGPDVHPSKFPTHCSEDALVPLLLARGYITVVRTFRVAVQMLIAIINCRLPCAVGPPDLSFQHAPCYIS